MQIETQKSNHTTDEPNRKEIPLSQRRVLPITMPWDPFNSRPPSLPMAELYSCYNADSSARPGPGSVCPTREIAARASECTLRSPGI
jgi:hypothetical protein